jgi:hypothetical protein
MSLDDIQAARGRGAHSEPWVDRAALRVHLGRDNWWIELRLREGMPSKPYGRPRQFRLSQVDAWLKDQGHDCRSLGSRSA